MCNKIAFFTVIYSNIEEKYINDYFDSLNNQTIKEFDIVLVNDGFKNLDFFKNKFSELNIVELDYQGTLAEIRERGINFLIENHYDIAVFGDFDDYIKEDRIDKTISYFKHNNIDIIINDFDIVDENSVIIEKNYLSNRLEDNSCLSFLDIVNKNFFGLSNSAIKLQNIEPLVIPKHIIAVDWYIFSIMMLNNYKAMFSNEIKTYYRQHINNTIGITTLNKEKIITGIKVKSIHYKYLSQMDDYFKNKYLYFTGLYEYIKKDIQSIEHYYEYEIKYSTNTKSVWWEDII